MKFVLAALIVMSSAAAFAMPTVGDDAKYNLTVSQQGQNETGTLESQLTQTNAQGQYLEQTTATVTGQQPQVQQAWVDGTSLITDAQVAQIIQNCAVEGGAMQSVTVPAGTFNACALNLDDDTQKATYWVATGVPFGIVKADMADSSGNHEVASLASFQAGK